MVVATNPLLILKGHCIEQGFFFYLLNHKGTTGHIQRTVETNNSCCHQMT